MDTTDLPFTQKGRGYEIHAMGLRDFAGLQKDIQRLDPFKLAAYAKLLVVSYDEIEAFLSLETKAHLTGDGKNSWSGGATSQALPDGRKIIILNPAHSKKRQNATLMEEVSHVFLGHKPSRLAIEKKTKDGKIIARDYNAKIEEQAYAVGAAALVPCSALRKFIEKGKTSRGIARHFDVSNQLVEYRMKILKLWGEYLLIQGEKSFNKN